MSKTADKLTGKPAKKHDWSKGKPWEKKAADPEKDKQEEAVKTLVTKLLDGDAQPGYDVPRDEPRDEYPEDFPHDHMRPRPIRGVEPQEDDTRIETTVREVLQLGIDGMEDLLTAVAADIEANQEELTNFDAPAFVSHLRAAVGVLQNSTGA